MDNSGHFIKYYREKAKLTMLSLAEGICTKDYIYMIEKGKRKPSIYILSQLASKLNFNIDDYLLYREFLEPDIAATLVKNVKNAMYVCDWKELNNICQTFKGTSISEKYPVSYYLNLSCYYSCIYNKGEFYSQDEDYNNVMVMIEQELTDMNIDRNDVEGFMNLSEEVLHYLNLYAICLSNVNCLKESLELFGNVHDALLKKRSIESFMDLYIISTLYYSKIMILNDCVEEGKTIALELYEFQTKFRMYNRIAFTLVNLSLAYKDTDVTLSEQYIDEAMCFAKISRAIPIIHYTTHLNEYMDFL